MPKPVSSIVLIAERFLNEQDRVISAIRIVDIFFVDPVDQDTQAEKKAVLVNVLIVTKFLPGSEDEHQVKLSLLRPSGALKEVGEPIVARVDFSNYPNAPTGLSVKATVPVAVTELGTHYFIVEVDGEEVGRTPFTLVPRPAAPEAEK
jgi:hypothetical protein